MVKELFVYLRLDQLASISNILFTIRLSVRVQQNPSGAMLVDICIAGVFIFKLMAKRFIDSELFKKDFMRGMKPAYKLLWIYLCCDCTPAGIWQCEFDIAQLRLQQKINWDDARTVFGDRIIELDSGTKWFLPDFIEFQYGQLSEKNTAHINTIKILNKYQLLDDNLKVLRRGFEAPLEGAKYTDKDKDEAKEKEKVSVKHLFIQSEFFNYTKFTEAIISGEAGEKYLPFDSQYYYEAVKNWSANGHKKIDWIATARNFMLGDLKKGCAKIKTEFQGKIKHINHGKQTGGFTDEEIIAAAKRASAGIH